MTLDDTLILAEKEVRQRPSNPVLEEHKDDPVVKHLWSRKEINVKELIPDKFEYVSKLGAASWKEAHLVYESIGELKIPRVIKIINETEFTKMFRDADSKDKIELMKKELLDGNPNSLEGLAFAYKEVLKNGELAMVEEFLPSSIEDINFEYRTFDENLEDLIGFAKGINSMHTSKNKIWGDGKPEHFRYTDSKYTGKKIPKLNDFGTASKGSWSIDKKQATGDFLYRAPETFKEYFRADKVNDVYSFGAVAYYMFTSEDLNKELFDIVTKEGKNLLEKVNLYENFMSTVEEKELKNYYKRKVKKLPKKIRNTIFDMIRPEQYKYEEKNINKIRERRSFRYQDGKEVLEALEEIKQNQIGSKYLKKVARKSIGPLAFTTVIGAGLLFGFYLNRTYEPKDLTYPEAIPVMELIELGNQAKNQDTIKFDREPFIPEETCTIGMAMDMANRTDKYRLNAKNNFHILNLSIAYVKAATSLGGGAMFSEGLQENYDNYRSLTNFDEYRLDDPHDARTLVSRVIPQALYAAKGGKDYVDTEDMMIYTFGGKKLFDKVKSEIEEHMKNGETDAYNYQKYKDFTTKDGERLVPKNVVKFVDLWNSYLGMPEHFLTEKTKALSDSLQANYTVKIVPTGKYQPLKK